MQEHPQIQRFRNDSVRFRTCHAGRRSYKTEIAKRTVIPACWTDVRESYFFGAPTREQAKRIAWPDLKAMSPKFTVDSISETDLCIRYKSGCDLWVIGFDKPERFEGKRWKGGILSEAPHMVETVWNETVAPALRDTRGWAIIEGVPEGKNWYYDLCEYARTSGDPEWSDYRWKTAEVLNPDEVEKERNRLDERTFRQEYEGSFESYEGRAYVYYDSDTHRHLVQFNPDLPLCVACDFNLDPCIWLIGQDDKGKIGVFDEIVMRQADIWRMCVELKKRLNEKYPLAPSIIFYGDYEHGKNRSVSATATSWRIIQDEFRKHNVSFRLKAHPRIVDRVNAVNSKLRNARGQALFELDTSCRELHKDFEMVDFEMLRKATDVGDRTHASDAIGYWIAFDYPVVAPASMKAL